MKKFAVFLFLCGITHIGFGQVKLNINEIEHDRVVRNADKFLQDEPVTVTAFHSDRSSGGLHDYFSEGDYWWPDPKDPEGPYIQRDGLSNPDNFVAHRKALIQFSVEVASLTAAYKITHNEKYALAAMKHLQAWFVNDATKMSPHLMYAQAVKGRSKGRGTGIIDTIHLIEVARSVEILSAMGALSEKDVETIKNWFSTYVAWMMTHPNGIEERDAKNNHGTCFFMQIAEFAKLIHNDSLIAVAKKRFCEVLLPNQMAENGSFPLELKRTKPYSYSIFNLDAMVTIAQILSDDKDNLWEFSLPDGRNLKKGIEFMYPFIKDKSTWKNPPDVMYFEYFPVRQIAFIFGGLAYQESKYIDLWKTLNPDPVNEEVIRNFPIRQPVLWLD